MEVPDTCAGDKLVNYKADQLPRGRYWEPEGEVRKILRSLKPHNDKSESAGNERLANDSLS